MISSLHVPADTLHAPADTLYMQADTLMFIKRHKLKYTLAGSIVNKKNLLHDYSAADPVL